MPGIFIQPAALRLLPLMLATSLAVEAWQPSIVYGKSPVWPRAKPNFIQSAQDTLPSPAPSKSALFNKESGLSRAPIGSGWFWFGVYVLIALIFSGLSGYTAVSKGLNAVPYFFMGFFFSAFGYLFVLTRPSAVKAGEVPAGLTKVHTTLEPVPCPKCGNTNHPAARKCLNCGVELQPLAESEVARVKL